MMSVIPKLILAVKQLSKSHVYPFTANFRSDVRNPKAICSFQTALKIVMVPVQSYFFFLNQPKSHITKQLMHSFDVNITISQPEKVTSIEVPEKVKSLSPLGGYYFSG